MTERPPFYPTAAGSHDRKNVERHDINGKQKTTDTESISSANHIEYDTDLKEFLSSKFYSYLMSPMAAILLSLPFLIIEKFVVSGIVFPFLIIIFLLIIIIYFLKNKR